MAAPPRQRRRPPRTKDPKVKGKRGKPGSGKPGPVGSTQIRGKGPTGGSTKPLVGRGSTSEDHSDNCNEYDDKDEDDEAFYSMSREEQLQHLKDKSQDDLAQGISSCSLLHGSDGANFFTDSSTIIGICVQN